ncbi:MAG TPA: hypothetical protein VG497_33090 [Kribbella sp.]|nr:hypothetical protein [Kribbella sp.]
MLETVKPGDIHRTFIRQCIQALATKAYRRWGAAVSDLSTIFQRSFQVTVSSTDGLPFCVIACTLLVSGPPKLPQGTVPAGRFLVVEEDRLVVEEDRLVVEEDRLIP